MIMSVGRVVSYDANNCFLFYVSSPSTGATGIAVLASPAADFFSLPPIGSYVIYQDGNSRIKRFVGSLNDDPTAWYGANGVAGNKLKDPNANPGNVTVMHVGDTYVGRYGRAYFNGDVFMHSDKYRSKLYLRDFGPAELKAYDFLIKTEDNGVSIFTEASLPDDPDGSYHFGDSLVVKRVVDKAADISTWLRLDHTGSATLSIMNSQSKAQFDINGDISLHCGTDGAAEPAPMAYIRLVNQVNEDGEDPVPSKINIYSGSYSAAFDKAATLSCDSLTETVSTLARTTCENSELVASKAISLSSESLSITTSEASSWSCDTFSLSTGGSASLGIGGDLTASASGSVAISGSTVSINGGAPLAYKSALEALAASVEQIKALLLSHTHPDLIYSGPGVVSSPGGTTGALVGSIPSASLGPTGTSKTTAG